jgi:hypothetical protein
MNDPLDYLHGAEYRTLEYDEQAQVKRLMQAGVARIENHKGKRIVILDGSYSQIQSACWRHRANHRSPFGMG